MTQRLLHLGQIPYLNCLLFFHALEGKDDIRLSPLVPKALSGAAADRAVDAGPVPLVDTWDIEDRYTPLDDFCISVINSARSVLFFSRVPFDRLEGAEIGITGESSTSVRLLKVMLAQVWRVRPARLTALDPARNDAYLVIGDEALKRRHGSGQHPHVADLGDVWHQWTGLPFVFARWVVRHDVTKADRARLATLLETSIATGWQQLDRIGARRAAELNMTIDEVRDYLQAFRFRATPEEHAAIKKFRELDASLRDPHAVHSTEKVNR